MPFRLGWQHTDVVDPVCARFESDYLDFFVSQLKSQRFIIRNEIGSRRYVPHDIRVNTRHVLKRVLLHLILIIVGGEDVVR